MMCDLYDSFEYVYYTYVYKRIIVSQNSLNFNTLHAGIFRRGFTRARLRPSNTNTIHTMSIIFIQYPLSSTNLLNRNFYVTCATVVDCERCKSLFFTCNVFSVALDTIFSINICIFPVDGNVEDKISIGCCGEVLDGT